MVLVCYAHIVHSVVAVASSKPHDDRSDTRRERCCTTATNQSNWLSVGVNAWAQQLSTRFAFAASNAVSGTTHVHSR